MFRTQKYPFRIHRHEAVPVLFAGVLDTLANNNARVIHQDIQLAVAVHSHFYGLTPVRFPGHIQMHIGGFTARRTDVCLHLLPLCIQDISQNHFGAFVCTQLRFRSALSPGTATNECYFAIEPAHIDLPSLDSEGAITTHLRGLQL
jgi:hypothetical protein